LRFADSLIRIFKTQEIFMPTTLITGANRGIGLELVRQYAEEGWRVIACCRSETDGLQEIEKKSNGTVSIHMLDVADHETIDQLAVKLQGTPIDLLLNNAGRYGRISMAEGGVEDQAFGNSNYADWEVTMRVNLFGPMKMAEAFIEHIAASDHKKIVTITSFLGSSTLNTRQASGDFAGGMYAYRTSKTAVNIMTRSMAADLEDRGVIVLAVHPGWVKTDMGGTDAQVEPADSVKGIRHIIASATMSHTGALSVFDGDILPP
jgi:NAD(P)-dependent dehydrogenase (short-subunit alcohol dehydrogenase family)